MSARYQALLEKITVQPDDNVSNMVIGNGGPCRDLIDEFNAKL
jgi:hypothetical protein